jgi:hypothetical protein
MSYSEQIQFYQDQAQWFFQKKENVKKLKWKSTISLEFPPLSY